MALVLPICLTFLSALVLPGLCQPTNATRDRRICYACDLSKSTNCSRDIQCFDGTWCLIVWSGDTITLRGCSWTNPVGDNKCYHSLGGERWCYCGEDLCNSWGVEEEDVFLYSEATSWKSCSVVSIFVPLILLVRLFHQIIRS